VTPSCAALFGWAFNPAIRDLDPPPAVAATVDRGVVISPCIASKLAADAVTCVLAG
jgi:phosphatidylserine decarboxylase